MDYSVDRPSLSEQETALVRMLSMGLNLSLPIVLHCRHLGDRHRGEAYRDCLEVLERQGVPRKYKVYLHCYNGSVGDVRRWRAAYPNVVFGFTGIILTSVRHYDIPEIIKDLPLKCIMLESDGPFLRSSRNDML